MKFERRYGKRRKSNPKKGLLLVFILIIVLLIWFNAETLMERVF